MPYTYGAPRLPQRSRRVCRRVRCAVTGYLKLFTDVAKRVARRRREFCQGGEERERDLNIDVDVRDVDAGYGAARVPPCCPSALRRRPRRHGGQPGRRRGGGGREDRPGDARPGPVQFVQGRPGRLGARAARRLRAAVPHGGRDGLDVPALGRAPRARGDGGAPHPRERRGAVPRGQGRARRAAGGAAAAPARGRRRRGGRGEEGRRARRGRGGRAAQARHGERRARRPAPAEHAAALGRVPRPPPRRVAPPPGGLHERRRRRGRQHAPAPRGGGGARGRRPRAAQRRLRRRAAERLQQRARGGDDVRGGARAAGEARGVPGEDGGGAPGHARREPVAVPRRRRGARGGHRVQ